VLLLHGWESAHHGAYAVLRTRRVSALSPAVREALRAGTADDLVLLEGTSAGHQRVAMLAGLTRLHGSAIDSSVVGHADDATMRRVGEGLATSLAMDLDRIVGERVEAALAELGIA
jgi:hypothetical protein